MSNFKAQFYCLCCFLSFKLELLGLFSNWLFFNSLFVVSRFRSTKLVKKVSGLFLHLIKTIIVSSKAVLSRRSRNVSTFTNTHLQFLLDFLFFKDFNTLIDILEGSWSLCCLVFSHFQKMLKSSSCM